MTVHEMIKHLQSMPNKDLQVVFFEQQPCIVVETIEEDAVKAGLFSDPEFSTHHKYDDYIDCIRLSGKKQ